jgi:two-component system NarL family sensor kinase
MGNKKKFFIFTCFFLCCLNVSFASLHLKIDSLVQLVPKKSDTALVHLYISIGQQYENFDLDSSKYFYNKAKSLSEEISYPKGILKFIANYTYVLNLEGKLNESLQLNKSAIPIALKTKDSHFIASAYSNTASSYQYLEKYDLAIQNYLKALDYLNNTSNAKNLSIIYANLTSLYENLGQNEKSLEFAIKSEDIARKFQFTNELANALTNKSNALSNLLRFEEAEIAVDEALLLADELESDFVRMTNLLNKSHIYMQLNKSHLILPFVEESLLLSRKLENQHGEILSLIGLTDYYLYTNNYEASYQSIFQAMELAREYGSLETLRNCALTFSNVSLAKRDFDLFHKYASLHDSLDNVIKLNEINKTVIDISEKYESDKKSYQIEILKEKNKFRFALAIALALTVLGLLTIIYSQFSAFKTKKQLFKLEKEKAIADERLRIATDMHDDVGVGLSRIRYISHSISNGNTLVDAGLHNITEISDDSISKMSEIIWALNESNQSLEELIYFIRSQASEMVQNAKLIFHGELPNKIPDLSFGWTRNRHTYLLVKEAINNAIKHSNASEISLKFEINNQLVITIQDNGIGFDTSKDFKGNGLNNYAKRIEKLEGNYNISSIPKQGTTLTFFIPFS